MKFQTLPLTKKRERERSKKIIQLPSHCTKIIVARLLKFSVVYSVWHPNTEPKFFRTRLVKRLRPAEKLIF